MSSVGGHKLKLSLFGESHGETVGVVLDGFPAGMKVDFDALYALMKRRAPGSTSSILSAVTARTETDEPHFVSGITDGYTNGFPICIMIANSDKKSGDYTNDRYPRPSHADYPALLKYGGHCDIRGGGHFSGRLTAPLTAAGGLCMQYLSAQGVEIAAHILQILNVTDVPFPYDVTTDELKALRQHTFPTIDSMTAEAYQTILSSAKMKGDSVGAVIQCAAAGLPAVLGGHCYESVEARLSEQMFAIPGVKGISFGDGFDFCKLYGSEANDEYEYRDGKLVTKSGHCGGVYGGMTVGMPVIFKIAMKPTPSIMTEQNTVDLQKQTNAKLSIHGRHDPCIALRAVAAVEAMTAVTFCDFILEESGRS